MDYIHNPEVRSGVVSRVGTQASGRVTLQLNALVTGIERVMSVHTAENPTHDRVVKQYMDHYEKQATVSMGMQLVREVRRWLGNAPQLHCCVLLLFSGWRIPKASSASSGCQPLLDEAVQAGMRCQHGRD